MAIHKGGCHCGAIEFDVTTDLEKVYSCNCSHCSKKGFLLTFVPAEQFTCTKGEDMVAEYRFNKKHIAHQFCPTCGVQPFAKGSDTEGKETVMINVCCLEDVDLDALTVEKVDGKSF